MESFFPWGPRLALAAVIAVVASSVDRRLGRRGRGHLAGVELQEEAPRDRAWRAGTRTLNGALGLGALAGAITLDPIPAFSLALGATLVGPAALGICARHALRRHASAPRISSSIAHHLANGAVIALASLFFRGIYPFLPSIVPLHWAGLGHAGYGPPTRLWWSLALLTWGTGTMFFAARVAKASSEHPWRRLSALRLCETVLLAFNLAVVALWIAVALNGIPGLRTTRAGVVLAVSIALGGVALGLFGELRDRRRGLWPGRGERIKH